jgi:hypothetical protein
MVHGDTARATQIIQKSRRSGALPDRLSDPSTRNANAQN